MMTRDRYPEEDWPEWVWTLIRGGVLLVSTVVSVGGIVWGVRKLFG